jgi:hypothetical protein
VNRKNVEIDTVCKKHTHTHTHTFVLVSSASVFVSFRFLLLGINMCAWLFSYPCFLLVRSLGLSDACNDVLVVPSDPMVSLENDKYLDCFQ